jgi:hypothetical protein
LSSAEDEYVAISEAAKKVMFDHYLLCDLHSRVKIPIIFKTENTGSIFTLQNASTGILPGQGRYHFVLKG